jgi:hypothetical protein
MSLAEKVKTTMLRRLRRRVEGLVAQIIRMTPVASTHLGPPKGLIMDFRIWAGELERKRPFMDRGWHHWDIPVRDAEVIQSRPPLSLEAEMPEPYREAQLYRYPPLFLAHVRSGRLALREGVVISPDDRVFDEFSYSWGNPPSQLPIFRRLRLPAMQHREGVFATILSPGSAAPNYFHWLIETLPRIAILEEAGIGGYRLIVPEEMAPWQTESLARLGFEEDRWVKFGEEHWQVDSLLVPSLLGFTGMCRPWAAKWMRRRLGVPEREKGTRRLYLSRSGARLRKVSNEEEVVAALDSLGFESVSTEGMTLEEQIALFSQAEFIVGLHGAGLTNALFAPRGTRIIEFMSPVAAYLNACYYSLSSAVDHRYLYVLGTHRPPRDTVPAGTTRWRENLEVPIPALSRAVAMLGG